MKTLFYINVEATGYFKPRFEEILKQYVDLDNASFGKPVNPDDYVSNRFKTVTFKSLNEIQDFVDSDYNETYLNLAEILTYFTRSQTLNQQGQLLLQYCLGQEGFRDLANAMDKDFQQELGITHFVIDRFEETDNQHFRLYWQLEHTHPLTNIQKQAVQDYLNGQASDGWGENQDFFNPPIDSDLRFTKHNIFDYVLELHPEILSDLEGFNPDQFQKILEQVFDEASLLINLFFSDGQIEN